MKIKSDEENFDEAESQAYRCWTETNVPSDIASLFQDPQLKALTPDSPPFFHLLAALQQFTAQPPHTLPLSSTLPDMKASTTSYIHLQKLYKAQAEEEKSRFKSFLQVPIDDSIVDSFVKNAHGIKVLRGKKWGTLDSDPSALGEIFLLALCHCCSILTCRSRVANAIASSPKPVATHLALSALRSLTTTSPGVAPTLESLTAAAEALLPPGTELPEEFSDAVGEMYVIHHLCHRFLVDLYLIPPSNSVRAPTADVPNTAAFLGGLVAQEVIKMITKQYVPIDGTCVVDLVETWTGII